MCGFSEKEYSNIKLGSNFKILLNGHINYYGYPHIEGVVVIIWFMKIAYMQ